MPLLRELLGNSYEGTRIYAAAGLCQAVGEADAGLVLDTPLQAWNKNGATVNFVVQVLEKMGPAAPPALPYLETELARTRRGGRFASIENDEDVQRAIQRIVNRVT